MLAPALSLALMGSAIALASMTEPPAPPPPPARATQPAPPAAPAEPTTPTSAPSADEPVEVAGQVTEPSQMLGRLLHTRMDVEFKRTPLADALQHVADSIGVAIVGRFATQANPNGLDAEEPMTMTVRGAAAIDVLESLLDRASSEEGNTWQFRRGFIEVGPKSRLSVPAARETRVYPIDDLTFVPPSFGNAPTPGFMGWGSTRMRVEFFNNGTVFGDPFRRGWQTSRGSWSKPSEPVVERGKRGIEAQNLIDLITSTIEPEAWDARGGTVATIRYHGATGGLVITAPDFIHRQIGGYPPAAPPSAAPRSAPAAPAAGDDEVHRRIPTSPSAVPAAPSTAPWSGGAVRFEVRPAMKNHLHHVCLMGAWIALAGGCRSHAPISGTPMQEDESLASGVDRGQNVFSLRQADLMASTDKLAGDIAAMLRPAGATAAAEEEPIVLALRAARNRSSLPASSHRRLMSQIWHGLRESGPRHGLSFIEAGQPTTTPPAFDLWTDLSGSSAGRNRSLFIDYHLVRTDAGTDSGDLAADVPAPDRVVWGKRYLVAEP